MKSFFINIIVLLVIFNISNSSILGDPMILLTIGILLLLVYLSKGRNINKSILILSFAWVLINFWAAIVYNKPIDLLLISRLLFNYILTPYLLIEMFGVKFWSVFEKWIFIFTLISIPLFFLNVINIPFFNSLKDIFDSFTRDVLRDSPNYWSIGIYTNAVVMRDGLIRNCGFMWEPGFFALMIIFGIIFNWLKRGVVIDKKFIVYAIALITTFSTSGYLVFGVLLGSRFLKRINIINVLAILILGFIFFNNVYKRDFMSGKINAYIEAVDDKQMNYTQSYNAIKLNRFQIALYDINRIVRNPLGYGLYDRIGFSGTDVTGTNGLTGILRMWGVFIFLYFVKKWWQYMNLFNDTAIEKRILLLFLASLLLMFFSNPIERNIFPYLIAITPLLVLPKTGKMKKLEKI